MSVLKIIIKKLEKIIIDTLIILYTINFSTIILINDPKRPKRFELYKLGINIFFTVKLKKTGSMTSAACDPSSSPRVLLLLALLLIFCNSPKRDKSSVLCLLDGVSWLSSPRASKATVRVETPALSASKILKQ